MIRHAPRTASRRLIPAPALALLTMTVLPAAAWGRTPTLFEPGFRIEQYDQCLALGSLQPVVRASACAPGGAWGTGLYVGAHTDTQGLILGLDPPRGAKIARVLGDRDDLSIVDLDFAPPGWRGGDLLWVTLQDGIQPNYETGAWGLDTAGYVVDSFMVHSFTEHIWRLAIDPTGAFDNDIFFWFGNTLYRRDASGGLIAIAGVTGPGALAFGPGGPWTTDLYTAFDIVAADGSVRPGLSPLEGVWAPGPGFEGDLFNLCAVGQTCRVKPDGTATLFGEDLGDSPVFCDGALWYFHSPGALGCIAIRPCGAADNDHDGFTGCEGDCDDTNAGVHPGAVDLPGNGIDEDCDGTLVCDPAAPWSNPGELVSCVARECSRLAGEGAVSRMTCSDLTRAVSQNR